jgi:hypothetical protein
MIMKNSYNFIKFLFTKKALLLHSHNALSYYNNKNKNLLPEVKVNLSLCLIIKKYATWFHILFKM